MAIIEKLIEMLGQRPQALANLRPLMASTDDVKQVTALRNLSDNSNGFK